MDVTAQDKEALDRLVKRECRMTFTGLADNVCPTYVRQDAQEIARANEMQARRSIYGLRALIQQVGAMPGRKVLVIISAGIPTSDRAGGKPDVQVEATELGMVAAAANVVLCVLHMDVNFINQFSAAGGRVGHTVGRDGAMFERGLDRFAGTAGGTFISVPIGPERAVDRVLRETSAFYLLGVEVDDALRDGRGHFIKVSVQRRGLDVRHRNAVVIPRRPPA